MLADALTSLLAIFALLTARYLGWQWMDPLMGIVGAVLFARTLSNLSRQPLGVEANRLLVFGLDASQSCYSGERMVLDFRAELVRHMQRLSFSYADKVGTADLLYRIQYDAPAIQWIALDVVIPLVSAVVTVSSMLYVAALIDLELALAALMVIPPLLTVLVMMRRRIRRRSRMVKQLESSALSVVQEGLGAIRVVKAFAQEHRESERFVDSSLRGVDGRLRLVSAEGGYGVLIAVITAVGTGAVLFIGARHVQAGVLTLGNLLLILGYLTQLYQPLRTMSHKAVRLQSHLASAERAFAVLDEVTRGGSGPLSQQRIGMHIVENDQVHASAVARHVGLHVALNRTIGEQRSRLPLDRDVDQRKHAHLLRLTVFEYLEVLLRQVGDESSLRVADASVDLHVVDLGAERDGWLLGFGRRRLRRGALSRQARAADRNCQ